MSQRGHGRRQEKLSFSRLGSWASCSQKYHYSYIEKLPRPNHIYFSYGKICHQIMENVNKHRLIGMPELYPLWPTAGIERSAFTDLYAAWMGTGNDFPDEDMDPYFLSSLAAIRYLAYTYTPEYEVTERPERRIECQIYNPSNGKRINQWALGFIDATCARSPHHDRLVLVDYKFVGRKWDEDEDLPGKSPKAEFDYQPTMYSYIMNQDIEFVFEIVTKPEVNLKPGQKNDIYRSPEKAMELIDQIQGKVNHQTITTDRDLSHRRRMYALIQQFKKAKENNLFYPSPAMSCYNYCDFADHCIEWGREDDGTG